MSIADKLTAIAENEQKVYDAGYDNGKKAQYDLMWNGLQNNGNTADYQRKFFRIRYGYAAWDSWYNPKYDFYHNNSSSAIDTFRECHVKDVMKDNYAYSGGMQFMYTFYHSTRLENARTFHVYENTTYQDPFAGCSSLKEIRFEGVIAQNGLKFSACTKLSKASIESVINALSSTTSGLTVTFSKTAVDKAFETSNGAADGSTSTEWTTLVASKSNWTIALG